MTTALMLAAELTQMQTGTVRVGACNVSYHDSVVEYEGRDPLVLVHGTGGSTRAHFPFLLPMLATAQRVISIDLVTPVGIAPEDGPTAFADQVISVLETVLPGRAIALTGYSLGAVVCTKIAAERPDLVSKLALIGGWMRTTAHQRLRNSVWLDLHERGEHDTLARFHAFAAFSQPFLDTRTPAELEAIVARAATDEATRAQMEMNRTVDLTTVAPRITCPTLVVAGTDDQMTPRRQSKALFGAIEDARYTEVTAGHAMVAERPAELVHLLTNFNAEPHAFPAGAIIPARRP